MAIDSYKYLTHTTIFDSNTYSYLAPHTLEIPQNRCHHHHLFPAKTIQSKFNIAENVATTHLQILTAHTYNYNNR